LLITNWNLNNHYWDQNSDQNSSLNILQPREFQLKIFAGGSAPYL